MFFRSSGAGQRLLFLQLGELAQNYVALQGGEMVDEQNAVEMIDLVLEAGREQPLGLDLLSPVVLVAIPDAGARRAFHFRIVIGQRKAAFLSNDAQYGSALGRERVGQYRE